MAKQIGLPNKVTERASTLLRLINENMLDDEDKKQESRFHLLRTESAVAQFNQYFIFLILNQ